MNRLCAAFGTKLDRVLSTVYTDCGLVPESSDELPVQFIAQSSLKAANTISMNLGQDRLAATNWMARPVRQWLSRHGRFVS